ncbi:MAG: 16S rRNA (uracil(1498)-N(3))-methyltransferase [Chlamydiales bacterium]|nr:16S rRNA (uracil(1498)-N(3))-methyltransferase [Chlamydiales bacterium]
MPHSRFYIDAPLEREKSLALENEEFHHLVRVMRTEVGEEIELVNGRDQLALARVERISKSSASLKLLSVEKEKRVKPKLILAQAMTRMPRLEWLIEKAVELGATEFWLFPSALSEIKAPTPSQTARLKQICISAMKQSGRLDLPSIQIFPSLNKLPKAEGTNFFGDLRPEAPTLLEIWKKKPDLPLPFTLFIGPEKGFKQEELLLLENERGALGIHLHANVLRFETAGVVGLTLLQAFN